MARDAVSPQLSGDLSPGVARTTRDFAIAERRATRIRRLTSAVILVVGVGLSSLAGSADGLITAALTIVVWVVVIAGTMWLFRHVRRSRR